MTRVLVCGGRDYADRAAMAVTLLRFAKPGTVIIHGGATGANALAGEWAQTFNVPCEVFPADWDRHGKAAGPIRNQEMIDRGQPDLVLAFPGGRGTADMVARARAALIRVHEVRRA